MAMTPLSSQISNRKRPGRTNERRRHLSLFGIFISACLGAGMYILSISFWMDENNPVSDRSMYDKLTAFLVQQVLPKAVDETNFTNRDVDEIKRKMFPSPLQKVEGGKIIMRPIYGAHRPDADAVFSFAQGYSLREYVRFVETLQKTGYSGDVVISVASVDKLDHSILNYLKSKKNVIVYAVSWRCFKRNGQPIENPDDYALCQILNFISAENNTDVALDDIRIPRPLATARYIHLLVSKGLCKDLLMDYCIFTRNVQQTILVHKAQNIHLSFVMILTNFSVPPPFVKSSKISQEHSSTLIGQSSFNSGWIEGAYGAQEKANMKDKRILCSGSTIGEQVAIESYLRAMIEQFARTKCIMKGCDQGMHNYLYYSGTLLDTAGIREVTAVEHGKGNVLNLSVLRGKPLAEWGLYDPEKKIVFNWDKTVAPIVHQFDRDAELSQFVRQTTENLVKELEP